MESTFFGLGHFRVGRILLFSGLVSTFLAQTTRAADFDSRFFSSAAKQRTFLTQIEAIMDANRDVEKAQRHYQIAKRSTTKDPRLEYAAGLVLFHQFEYDKAGTQFDAATDNKHAVYLPAWQAKIVLHLMQSNREAFLTDSLQLAKLAADDRVEWIGTGQPQVAAGWLGEVMAFLALPKVEFLKPEDLSPHDQQIQAAISPALLLYWTLGKQKFRRKYEAFQQEIAQQQEQVKDQIEDTADKRTTRLDERRKEIEQQKQAAQRSATEWQAWYDKQMERTKKRLDSLQKDYNALEAVAKRLNAIILQTQYEIGQLQTLVNLQGRTQRPGAGLTDNQIALGEHQEQLVRYQLQYFALEQRGTQLMVQARHVMLARQAAAKQYQQATGQIAKRDQTLTRWKNLVQKSALKAVAKANDTDPIEALEKRLAAATSYFPIDFETEKTHLLNSYPQP